jgi:aspartate ammonia-lyase
VPVTLGGEFYAYADYARSGKVRIEAAMQKLLDLNLGGNAVGNSVNASPKYIKYLYVHLKKVTGLPVKMAKNLMAKTSSGSDFVWLSQSLTAFCVDLSKISNDLRWLSAGPKGGIGELSMPELQAGSSIMPGKVNPVLSEAISQLYFLVSGNNLTIEHAAEGSQLELGVMLPIATDRLNESLTLSAELLKEFTQRCVAGIKAHPKRAKELLENSTAYATYFAPILGYDTVSQAVKEALALGKTFRQMVLEKKFLTNKEFDAVVKRNIK